MRGSARALPPQWALLTVVLRFMQYTRVKTDSSLLRLLGSTCFDGEPWVSIQLCENGPCNAFSSSRRLNQKRQVSENIRFFGTIIETHGRPTFDRISAGNIRWTRIQHSQDIQNFIAVNASMETSNTIRFSGNARHHTPNCGCWKAAASWNYNLCSCSVSYSDFAIAPPTCLSNTGLLAISTFTGSLDNDLTKYQQLIIGCEEATHWLEFDRTCDFSIFFFFAAKYRTFATHGPLLDLSFGLYCQLWEANMPLSIWSGTPLVLKLFEQCLNEHFSVILSSFRPSYLYPTLSLKNWNISKFSISIACRNMHVSTSNLRNRKVLLTHALSVRTTILWYVSGLSSFYRFDNYICLLIGACREWTEVS